MNADFLDQVESVISNPIFFVGFHGCNTLFSNWQPGVLKYYWVNWQWAGSHIP